ncbi:ABC transporter permease [Streptomyces sp. NBC_00859]|uniref:ABC transporter permease n=1 Tax=Streptomyces sp. NBC_00859 TaxID=2903682 RepID=UPI0038640EF5|nr:ABC transporter permease [Streptomyces sp. NBC_00859]
MSTATATTGTKVSAGPAAPAAVLRTEFRLFRREPATIFWVMVFPTILLVILGSIPSFREHDPSVGGQTLVSAYVPVTVLLAMIMAGLQVMPQVITGYRERGILRRMSTTPVRPHALLTAQMGLHGVAALVSTVLSLGVARTVFKVALPQQIFGYVLSLALAVCAALALGSLVAALSRNQKVANAIGSAVLFPMMFCAGVWLPVQAMPDALGHIVELTPFGAAAQALDQAATGGWPGWSHLGVLALWTVLLSAGANRWFRWE